MTEVGFEGTLADLLRGLSRILPPPPGRGGRWRGPEVVWDPGGGRLRRVIVEHEAFFDPDGVAEILKTAGPGDCLVFLGSRRDLILPGALMRRSAESPGRHRPARDAFFRWSLEFLHGFMERGVALITAGNTWEAWEKGPARMIASVLEKSLPVTEKRPVAGFLTEKAYKVVVFVPRGYEDAVRNAMASRGAGHIGNYSHCTFQAAGQGTFLPLEGSSPFIGRHGELERAEEWRLETLVRERCLESVVEAMLGAHPYEEVAYDVFELKNAGLLLGTALAVDFGEPVEPGELKKALGEMGDGEAAGEETGKSSGRVVVARFCGPEEVEAAVSSDAGTIVYVEDTYAGRVWRTRFGLAAVRTGPGVYDRVAGALCDALRGEKSG